MNGYFNSQTAATSTLAIAALPVLVASGVLAATGGRNAGCLASLARLVAPLAGAAGTLWLLADWPRTLGQMGRWVLATPLLVATEVLLAVVLGVLFRRRPAGDPDQRALELADPDLYFDVAGPSGSSVGESNVIGALVLFTLGALVLAGVVLGRLLWRLTPRWHHGPARLARAGVAAAWCVVLFLGGVFVTGASPPSEDTPVDGGLEKAGEASGVEELWTRTLVTLGERAPNTPWRRYATPALPLAWPPDRSTSWARYHYGAGDERSLADAVHVSTPFAVEYLGRGARVARLQALPGVQVLLQSVNAGTGLHEIRFFTDEELVVLRRAPAPESQDERDLRAFFEVEFLGPSQRPPYVLANWLRTMHAAFFAWLEGKGSGPTR